MNIFFHKTIAIVILLSLIVGNFLIVPAKNSVKALEAPLPGEGNLGGPIFSGGGAVQCESIFSMMGNLIGKLPDIFNLFNGDNTPKDPWQELAQFLPMAGSHVPTLDVGMNPIVPQDMEILVKSQIPAQLHYKAEECLKEQWFDKIAWQISKFLIRQIVDDLAQWLRGGAYGKPRFITDFDEFLKEAGDNAGGLLLEQILGRENAQLLCAPWRFQIALDIFGPRNRRDDFELNAQCKISDILRAAQGAGVDISIPGGPNISIDANENGLISNFYNDFSQGGWPAFLTMALDDGSNPIGSYLMTLEEKEQRIAFEMEKRKLEATVNKGLLIGACVKKYYSSVTGRDFCLKTEITSPGVAIEGALESAFGSEIRQLELADEINELVAAALEGIKMRLLWNRGIVESNYRGGLQSYGWLSDSDPRNSGSLDIWQPFDSTESIISTQIDGHIAKIKTSLNLATTAKNILEEAKTTPGSIAWLISRLRDLDPINESFTSIENDIPIWIDGFGKSIQYFLTRVYPADNDNLQNMLNEPAYKDWKTNRAQRLAFCGAADSLLPELKDIYLANLKKRIICANTIADLETIKNEIAALPDLINTSATQTLDFYNTILNTKSNLGVWYDKYNPELQKPGLVKPDDGATIKGEKINFRWSIAPNAVNYNLQIYLPDDSRIDLYPIAAEHIFTAEEVAAAATGNYSWRVTAIDNEGKWSKWSDKWNFTLEAPPLE